MAQQVLAIVYLASRYHYLTKYESCGINSSESGSNRLAQCPLHNDASEDQYLKRIVYDRSSGAFVMKLSRPLAFSCIVCDELLVLNRKP